MEKIAIVPVGGWLQSQLRPHLLAALKAVPDTEVWVGSGENEFSDSPGIWGFINARPTMKVYFAGHSLGVDQSISCALLLGNRCIGCALLDPVNWKKHDPKCKTRIFRADNSSPFFQAAVDNLPSEMILGTSHDSLCHDPHVISDIIAHIASCRTQ